VKILIIKQSALGDVLHVTGHLSAIRELEPNSRIVVLCSQACAPILRHHPAVDELLEFDRRLFASNWFAALVKTCKLIKSVRKHRFDLALDLQGRARSAIFLYTARARRKFIKGHFPFLNGFQNRSLHAIDEITQVVKLADLNIDTDLSTRFYIQPQADDRIDALLAERSIDQFILMSPFSTHPAKDWTLTGYKNLIDRLLQNPQLAHYQIFVTGTLERTSEIEELSGSISGSRVHNLAGQIKLDEFAALVDRAELLVTGDSFPMHLSASLATPLLAIFGPTRESQVGPRGTGPTRVIRAADCDGCARPRLCQRRCLSNMPADHVYDATLALLNTV